MQKMFFNVCLLLLINIFFYTINAMPYERYRRQVVPTKKDGLPYGGWAGGSNNPSGAIPGAYYGTGVNPNYGGLRPNTNDAHNGVNAVNYYNDYNSNWNPQQQQQQQYFPYNNNYNYNRPNNRYPPGSQGWYASGGNHWYNKGQSLIPHAWLLIINILISIISI